jgi:hypothetical protein
MPGDGMDVQEPEDEQGDGNQAHDGQRRDQEQREAVQAACPLPVAAPPRLFEHRKRLGRHPNTDLPEAIGRQPSPGQTSGEVASRSRGAHQAAPRGCRRSPTQQAKVLRIVRTLLAIHRWGRQTYQL